MNNIIEAMVTRRSCKSYRPDPVPEPLLDQVLLAGTYAANGMGKQSAKIVALTRPEDIAELEKMNAAILGSPQGHPFYGAPVVLVVLADPAVPTAVEDGSLVIGNLMLAAHALGLGACWVHRARQEFDSPAGKALLKRWGVNESYLGIGHCLLGYPQGPDRPAPPRKADFVTKV